MRSLLLFLAAGLLEIGGGYGVWLWLRDHRSAWLGAAGLLALALYGVVPVFQPEGHGFGRIYAAYGAIFIVLSGGWGWGIEGVVPDRRDLVGILLCLLGAAVMMGPRAPGGG